MELDALLRYMLADAPGCPDITAKMALINAAIELCTDTLAWNEVLDPVVLIDKVSDYDLEAPTGARVTGVIRVTMPHGPVHPATKEDVQTGLAGWATAQGSTPCRYTFNAGQSTLTFFPRPMGAQRAKFIARVAYVPILGAEVLPDSLVNAYLETITSGALARVLATPGRAWSNPQLADYHSGLFQDGKSKARADVLHDDTRGTITVTPRRFI